MDESRSKCGVCRLEHDQNERGRVACRRCERRTTTDLQALADAFALLVDAGYTALTPRQHGNSTGGRGGSSADERSPVRMSVLSLTGPGGVADWLRLTLLSWYDDLGFKLPARKVTFADLVTRMVNNLPWAAENRADFREFARLVATQRDQCEIALDPAKATPRVPIGRCPATDDDGCECGAKLTVDPFADHIRCQACGAVWLHTEWVLLGSVLALGGVKAEGSSRDASRTDTTCA